MNSESQDPPDGPGKIHTVQPLRDLESNWTVDLAKSLEDYLLKICSGEITGSGEAHFSVNFAEAALLLQGSVQVYSRKVEYLHNLVLHALEFISQTRSQDCAEKSPEQAEASASRAVNDEDDQFWVFDEIPVEAKNCLENVTSKESSIDRFIKPPANLVVLEGECLDSSGDGGELESYLLATNDLYCDFILLDPCDAVAVDEFLKSDNTDDGKYCSYRGSSLVSKAHKSFMSPLSRYSEGKVRKSSVKKGQDISQSSPIGDGIEKPCPEFEPGPSNFDTPNGNTGFGSDDHLQGNFDDSDNDDEDDPWKPLNPHESGNLKLKPFKKVKIPKKLGMAKQSSMASLFPLAKLNGTITPELMKIWEMGVHQQKRQEKSESPCLYEKLRESLVHGGNASYHTLFPPDDGDAENIFDDGLDDIDQPDFGIPDTTYMDADVNIPSDKHDDYANHCDIGSADVNDNINSQASLEDLCRAHLDSLLASIAESEKQTELAARVSTWKQRIEHDLEDEDSRPPFDIHEYGDRILDRLSTNEGESIMSFTDVVNGQEKHDVARTFSALLQLVNERKVDLDRSTAVGDSFCFTSDNPFKLTLLSNEKDPMKIQFQPTKKRQKSPVKRPPSVISSSSSEPKTNSSLAQPSCKSAVKLEKKGLRWSPDGKRRRKSRLVKPVDPSSAS